MRRENLRLSARHRAWFYGVFLLLFASGAAWLALHTWGARETEFDTEPSRLEPVLLKTHGAAAMAALVLFGTLIPLHLRRGWRAHRNRFSGGTLTAFFLLLVATGYGLYYAAGETLRPTIIVAHDVVGLAFPLLVVWHIARGRRSRSAADNQPRTRRG